LGNLKLTRWDIRKKKQKNVEPGSPNSDGEKRISKPILLQIRAGRPHTPGDAQPQADSTDFNGYIGIETITNYEYSTIIGSF